MKYLGSLLAVAFIVLKLVNAIDWDWFWVLSPIWGYVALWICALAFYAWAKAKEEQHEDVWKKTTRVKSKWQERLEQMQREQQKHS